MSNWEKYIRLLSATSLVAVLACAGSEPGKTGSETNPDTCSGSDCPGDDDGDDDAPADDDGGDDDDDEPGTVDAGSGSSQDAKAPSGNGGSRDASSGASRDAASDSKDAASSGGGDAAPSGPPPATGPVDGDPSKPMVSIPGVTCGPPAGRGVPPTVKIGGRDVVVAYPCAREGAQVTFLFVLHGTLDEAQKFSFTLNAGPYHRLADSHNVIYVLPKAIGTQWGNGDNGMDLPHLYEVVDWVYATFGTKFNIRSMWAQGGSWGAFYLGRTFACDPKFKDRLKGVRMVVGGGSCPAGCSDRLSCIVAEQELEVGMGMALTPEGREMRVEASGAARYAMSKGCMPKKGPTMLGTVKYWEFPGCQKGWVYSYYMGPGQHADPWDMASVTKSMEEMKSIEQ